MVEVAREAESMKAQVRIVVSFVCGFAMFLVWKMEGLKEAEVRKRERRKGLKAVDGEEIKKIGGMKKDR